MTEEKFKLLNKYGKDLLFSMPYMVVGFDEGFNTADVSSRWMGLLTYEGYKRNVIKEAKG